MSSECEYGVQRELDIMIQGICSNQMKELEVKSNLRFRIIALSLTSNGMNLLYAVPLSDV